MYENANRIKIGIIEVKPLKRQTDRRTDRAGEQILRGSRLIEIIFEGENCS
jgi:hypothetical protein